MCQGNYSHSKHALKVFAEFLILVTVKNLDSNIRGDKISEWEHKEQRSTKIICCLFLLLPLPSAVPLVPSVSCPAPATLPDAHIPPSAPS